MKLAALTLAAATALGTSAAADGYFSVLDDRDASSYIELDIVTTDMAGVVEIYDFRTGTVGELLGTQAVSAGANNDVRIDLGSRPLGDVLAVLKAGDEILDQAEIDIERF